MGRRCARGSAGTRATSGANTTVGRIETAASSSVSRRRAATRPEELDGIPESLGIIPRLESYRGLVFGCLDPGAQPLRDFLGVTTHYIDDWMDASPTGEIVVTGGVWRHRYRANWKIGVEGSDERYHADILHKALRTLIERQTGKPFRFQPPDLTLLKTIDAGNGHGISEINSDEFPRPWKEMNPPEYVEALVARLGERRTAEVLGRWARWHTFPNAAFTTDNIRVLRPVSVCETEVYQYHVSFPEAPGVTERINEQRVRDHQLMYGSSGYVGPDDHEMFERIQEGLRATAEGLTPWVWFSRGAAKSWRGDDGELIGLDQTELSQRSIYGGWRRYMGLDQ